MTCLLSIKSSAGGASPHSLSLDEYLMCLYLHPSSCVIFSYPSSLPPLPFLLPLQSYLISSLLFSPSLSLLTLISPCVSLSHPFLLHLLLCHPVFSVLPPHHFHFFSHQSQEAGGQAGNLTRPAAETKNRVTVTRDRERHKDRAEREREKREILKCRL